MSAATVRTRIAPSPTGDPHVGTAYIALLNMVFARSQGGQFVLRIEDTDQARSSEASEAKILAGLRWLGLDWEEGPDVGGPFGPYRQSERAAIYQEHAQRLLDSGHAFHCFCTPERLDELRRSQQQAGQTTRYDGLCRHLSPAEVQARIASGEAHVVRMVVPEDGDCLVQDLFRDEISIPWSQIDMQVLVKRDGLPTYHLAAVVDDHLMQITHALRGEEWINSAPKHLQLYEAFGWEAPLLGHLPLLRNPDKSKLSKRKNPTSVNYFRDAGYLPEALLNFLGSMGGAMVSDEEVFSLAQMQAEFALDKVRLGAPVFDIEKLNWLNGQWLRGLSPEAFAERLVAWRANGDFLQRLIPLLQSRVERLGDVAPLADYLLGERRAVTTEDFVAAKADDPEQNVRVLQFLTWRFEEVDDWRSEVLFSVVKALAEAMAIPLKRFLPAVFVAVGGKAVTLPLFDSLELLGRDLVRVRLKDAIEVNGGVSKKVGKRLEQAYQKLGSAQD